MSDLDASRLIDAALTLAQALDRDVAPVWARASPTVRDRLDAATLEEWTAQARARGAVVQRKWAAMQRFESDGSAEAAGMYLRVTFDSAFANGVAGEEMLVLHRDDDGAWRLAGYAMR